MTDEGFAVTGLDTDACSEVPTLGTAAADALGVQERNREGEKGDQPRLERGSGSFSRRGWPSRGGILTWQERARSIHDHSAGTDGRSSVTRCRYESELFPCTLKLNTAPQSIPMTC